MAKEEKKVITQELPTFPDDPVRVRFDIDKFESAITEAGYNVYHHKALKCPCRDTITNSSLPNCENCNGIGWFYVEKTKTKMIVQNINNNKKFEVWSETNAGTCTITSYYKDSISYMDKIELLDLEASYSQILKIFDNGELLFSFTTYEPLYISHIFKFISSGSKLVPLVDKTTDSVNWDYYIDRNKIVFNPSRISVTDSISVKYKHTPVYGVIDIVREVMKSKEDGCSPQCETENNGFRGQPMKSIGKRFHYMFDANNVSGPSVFDNTVYKPTDAIQTSNDDNIIY